MLFGLAARLVEETEGPGSARRMALPSAVAAGTAIVLGLLVGGAIAGSPGEAGHVLEAIVVTPNASARAAPAVPAAVAVRHTTRIARRRPPGSDRAVPVAATSAVATAAVHAVAQPAADPPAPPPHRGPGHAGRARHHRHGPPQPPRRPTRPRHTHHPKPDGHHPTPHDHHPKPHDHHPKPHDHHPKPHDHHPKPHRHDHPDGDARGQGRHHRAHRRG
jgi:hypothetical protein